MHVAYPSALPGPQPGSFAPRQRRATSSIDGPLQQRARQRDGAGLASQYTYVYTPEQMAVWLAWYRDALLDGRRWFAHGLPGRGGMVPRVVRYREVSQHLLGAGIYRVSASFEQRGDAPAAPPTDPLWGSVVALLHCDGANGGTTFVDSSSFARTVTSTGTANTSTAQVKYGASSIALPGSSRVDIANSASMDFLTGDFTIEAWCYFTSVGLSTKVFSCREWGTWTTGGFSLHYYYGGWIWQHQFNNTGSFKSVPFGTAAPAQNAWMHVAISRSGPDIRLFVDGAQVDITGDMTVQPPVAMTNYAIPLTIGGPLENNSYMTGYFDEFRLTKAARYTANFTPPAGPFPHGG